VHQRPGESWLKNLHDSCLKPGWRGRRFFARTGGARVRANDGAVHEEVRSGWFIGTALMPLLEYALLAPSRQPCIDGVPVAVLLGEEPPWCAAASHP
jgi:hypothetical protein